MGVGASSSQQAATTQETTPANPVQAHRNASGLRETSVPQQSRAEGEGGASMMAAAVPHMFVQRQDALPSDIRTALLGESGRQMRGPRPSEIPEDSETMDYSEQPYDSIQRQLELQWRVYAKLEPQAARDQLRQLQQGFRQSSVNEHATGPVPATPASSRSSQPTGADLSALISSWLPSAQQLQQGLALRLQPEAGATASTEEGPASRGLAPSPSSSTGTAGSSGGGGGSAASSPPGGQAAGRAAEAGSSSGRSPGPDAAAAYGGDAPLGLARWQWSPLELLPDPNRASMEQTVASLERMHRQQLRPLRRGRRARLLAAYGPQLPPGWCVGDTPSRAPLYASLLAAASAARDGASAQATSLPALANDAVAVARAGLPPRVGRQQGAWEGLLVWRRRALPRPVWDVHVDGLGDATDRDGHLQGSGRGNRRSRGNRFGSEAGSSRAVARGDAGNTQAAGRDRVWTAGGLSAAQLSAARMRFELRPGAWLVQSF